MAALTIDRQVPATKHLGADGIVHVFKMPAATQIWKGGLCAIDTAAGYVVPCTTDIAARMFAGLALESKLSGASAGVDEISVVYPEYFTHNVTGATIASIGDIVTCTDDQTLVIPAGPAATNFAIGWIAGFISGTSCVIKTLPLGSKALA